MPTADAHLHLFRGGYCGQLGISPSGGDELEIYEHLRARHHIERGLVLGYEAEHWCQGNTEFVCELARGRSWMAPVAYVGADTVPTSPGLRRLAADGSVGIAVYPADAEQGRLVGGWPDDVLDTLNELQSVVSVNADPNVLEELSPALVRLDACAVMISHLGQPGEYGERPSPERARAVLAPLLELSRREHICVKFSGLYGVSCPAHDFPHASAQPFVDAILEQFGTRRLLWGSDFAPALDHVSFEQTADTRALAACTADETADIMGGNLLRILAVQERSSGAAPASATDRL